MNRKGFCSECQSDQLWAWYPVYERQTIDVEITEAGIVAYDYSGVVDSASDPGEDEEFYCGNCFRTTKTIEEMVGLPAPPEGGGVEAAPAEPYQLTDRARAIGEELAETDLQTEATNRANEIGEITVDYMAPVTVRVDMDSGEVLSVWLHLESFQSSPSGRFKGPGEDGLEVCFRNAFIAGVEGIDDGEYCDGENELGDKALAIADRVEIICPEFQVAFKVVEP